MVAEFLPTDVLEQPEIQFSVQSTSEEQFLQFNLLPDTTALLPIHQLKEVLTIPLGQIVPIPRMPAYIMGVHNWRGEILWMLDLGHLLGLTPLHQQMSRSHYTAIVIHPTQLEESDRHSNKQTSDGKTLGLVISSLGDMQRLNPNSIRSVLASAVTPASFPFLEGHWLSSTGEIQAVLDGNAIFARLP